jgi:two-component system, oxyanion-binding sensor
VPQTNANNSRPTPVRPTPVPAKTPMRAVRIGFVPLIDAAPLIVALEKGLFREEGLDVTLSREIGWGNVRDKLAYGHLHASHALLGLPIQSQLGQAGDGVTAVMSLGSGGDAITLSERLVFSGVNSAASLGKFVRQSRGQVRPVFAHVFSGSMHHYLLRDWLSAGELNPDDDVRLCVLPPAQMSAQMSAGYLDGFCVGEPWNTLAHRGGAGRIVALTTDILPAHPEKVLAVNNRWARREPDLIAPMIRAILRGCAYCSDPTNHEQLAALLGKPKYLNLPTDVILASLLLDRGFGLKQSMSSLRPHDWQMRSFNATFPAVTHFAWMATQMVRWGHADASVDPWELAMRCVDASHYREAASELAIACPPNDTPPMALRHGKTFDYAQRELALT